MAAVESDALSLDQILEAGSDKSLEESPDELWARLRRDWLVGLVEEDRRETQALWVEKVGDRRHYLESYETAQSSPLVLIAESDPADCLAYLWAALLARWNVALANPIWGVHEWKSVGEHLQPTVIWGDSTSIASLLLGPKIPQPDGSQPSDPQPHILIPTGGSSGQVKFARHTWASLMASVNGFRQYFASQGRPINACCVLSVYHVSGLMQVLRAWQSNAQIAIAPFKQLTEQLESTVPCRSFENWFISLVPTQLEQLLQANQGDWLRQFQAVLLGGAPPWPTLLARAAAQQIPLCLSYGMTETAAMVTALTPTEFLQGRVSSGRSLPHVTVQIVNSDPPVSLPVSPSMPETLSPGEIGRIVVRSAAVAQGYFDGGFSQPFFYTDDLGYLSADGHLHITGRASNKIISGGENIFPAEVEAAIRSTGQVQDVCVIGLPDPHWGEAVVAAYVPINPSVCSKSLQRVLIGSLSTHPTAMLSRYKHPKYWLPFDRLPRNAQGKLNRQQLLDQLNQHFPRVFLNSLPSPLAQPLKPDDGDRAS